MKNVISIVLFTINVNILMAQDFNYVFDSIEIVYVEGGSFTMGCAPGDNDCAEFEKPAHKVNVNSFYISKFEISQKLWCQVLEKSVGYTGRKISGLNNSLYYEPAVVNPLDIKMFIEKLNLITGKNYRLPTEAEWEFAARGGNKSLGYKYAGSNKLDSVAHWIKEDQKIHYDFWHLEHITYSGTKAPNELGIYDMSGNVAEMCQFVFDKKYKKYYKKSYLKYKGFPYVLRGGYSFHDDVERCFRVTNRDFSFHEFSTGFRLVLDADDQEKFLLKNQVKPDSIEMVFVKGGSFEMGCSFKKKYCSNNLPLHTVTLSDFQIGKYEVTQAQWKEVMGENPSYFAGRDNFPVDSVSWSDVNLFIKKLNLKTGKNYRLPTEAEWEYVARGGIHNEKYTFPGSNKLDEVAWHFYNSSDMTYPVGLKKPNKLGVYDIQGNVSEWCADWYNRRYYENSASENPLGPTIGTDRIIRGSNFLSKSYEDIGFFEANASYRNSAPTEFRYPSLGLRLAQGPLPKENSKSKNMVFVDSIEMIYVEGGKFTMGHDESHALIKYDVKEHDVKLNSFYIGKFEITKAQWMAIMNEDSKEIPDCPNCPVDSISLEEIIKFTMKLNQKTGKRYRLPTEAEWEYAARGGKFSRGFNFSGAMTLDSIAWHYLNSEGKLQPVGRKVANELGIYDMSGNVSELCSDVYDKDYYISSEEENPKGPGMTPFINPFINPFILEPDHAYNFFVVRGGDICDSWIGRNGKVFIRDFTPIGPGKKCLGLRLVLEP